MGYKGKYNTVLISDARFPNDEPVEMYAFDNVKDIESFKRWFPNVFTPKNSNYIKYKDMNWHIHQGETILIQVLNEGKWNEKIWWSTLSGNYSEINLEVTI